MALLHTALLLLLSASISSSEPPGKSIKTDASSLLSFKKMIQQDPNAALSTWRPDKPPCTWAGVTCNAAGRVAAVDLAQSNLAGRISFAPFASLDMLTSLNLSANSFAIDAATSLAAIPYFVTELELSLSGLLGRIPENLFSGRPNLERVNLAFNNITDSLPDTLFTHIDKLRYLDLSYNNISGSISGLIIESCSSLSHLDWSGNQISGSLPPSLANCSALTELLMPENSLSGEIPATFGSLKSLQRLDLSQNHLSGWISYEIGGDDEDVDARDDAGAG